MNIEPLCDKTLAVLHVRYIVPLAVSSILCGDDVMDDIAEYTIQDIMSEFEPDEALMALALCSQHIAGYATDHLMGRALKLEADKIVEEYGPVLLAHDAGDLRRDEPAVADLLLTIPEDLECLSDILLALGSVITDETRAIVAILCDILGEQAEIHREYAEYKLDELDLQPQTPPGFAQNGMMPVGQADPSLSNNVIPFPVNRRFA